ncbi:MAG: 4-alpha-glucanotransferase, partial [Planctomycetia bacterium]|nr:4-alpha-glucanotransferase [Planctomycetia bacterium]
RQVLEALSAAFFAGPSGRREALIRHCRENPELERFARFRATGERQGGPWPDWPEPLRRGTLSPGDFDEAVYRYHLYTQWQVDEQLRSMSDRADRLGMFWYLDFPLGVSASGYDAWREQDLFVREASAGAPPDAFFTKGQNWCFPPLNPRALRRQGYRYFIRALQTHLRHARVLRLDHVMGLFRFYWIPDGMASDDGVYVRYPMEELFAILSLESHRFGVRVVGENLGTVPAPVDEAMERHGVGGMYVLQYETNPDKGPALRPVPAAAVASVNTHDMPPFAAYWKGLDVADRVDLGLLAPDEAVAEDARRGRLRNALIAFFERERLLDPSRDHQDLDVLEACQAYLARSPADVVLVNLEDLWGETEPQNVPGTYHERPNWRRKARYSFEVFRDMPAARRILATVDRLRRQGLVAE